MVYATVYSGLVTFYSVLLCVLYEGPERHSVWALTGATSFLLMFAYLITSVSVFVFSKWGRTWGVAGSMVLAAFTVVLLRDSAHVALRVQVLRPVNVPEPPPYTPSSGSDLEDYDRCDRIGYQALGGQCRWTGCVVDQADSYDGLTHWYLEAPALASCMAGEGYCDEGLCHPMEQMETMFDEGRSVSLGIALALAVNFENLINAHDRNLTALRERSRFHTNDALCTYTPAPRALKIMRERDARTPDVFLANGQECGFLLATAMCFQGQCLYYDIDAETALNFQITEWPGTDKIALGYGFGPRAAEIIGCTAQ